jgi:hypothetical protein
MKYENYLSSDFFPKDCQVILKENESKETYYEFEYKEIHINILVHEIKHFTRFNKLLLDRIFNVIKFFIDTFVCKESKILNIILIPLKNKKQFPTSNILDAINVNNGFTTTYLDTGYKEIFIYRREDIIKVLIHEMIHYFKLDIHNKNENYLITNVNDIIYSYIFEENKIDFNEIYTESLAFYMYIKFKYKQNTKKYIKKYTKKFIKIAKALIIHHKKVGKLIDFSNSYAYYLGRAFMFYNIDAFVKCTKSQNPVNDMLKILSYKNKKNKKIKINYINNDSIDPLFSMKST